MSNAEYHKLFGDNPGVPCDDAWKNALLERINESQASWVSETEHVPVKFDPSFPSHGAVVVFGNWDSNGSAYIIRYPDGSYHEVTDDWYHTIRPGKKNYVPINSLEEGYACGTAEELCAYYLYVGKDYKFTDEDDGSIERGGRYYSNAEPASYESVLSQRFFNKEFDDILNSIVDDGYKEYLIKRKEERKLWTSTGSNGPEEFLSLSWEDYHAAVDTAVSQSKHLLVVVRDMLYS